MKKDWEEKRVPVLPPAPVTRTVLGAKPAIVADTSTPPLLEPFVFFLSRINEEEEERKEVERRREEVEVSGNAIDSGPDDATKLHL